jgi:hypothetical protein
MTPRQCQVKPGHFKITVGERSLDVVEVCGRWYVNQFPDPPIDCGASQSAAAFKAVQILEAHYNQGVAA